MKKNTTTADTMNTTTTTAAPVDTIPTTTTTTEKRKEVPTMKNTMNTTTPAAPIVTPDTAPLYTPTAYGAALVTFRADGGSHTITAKLADYLLSVSIDEYRADFFTVRAAAVALDTAYTTPGTTPAAVGVAEDALSAALRVVYTRACDTLFPDRADLRYTILALNSLKKAKDTTITDGTTTTIIKGTRDFRPVSDGVYIKAIENLIATRLMGQKWDAELNNFRAPTVEEEEKTRARIARYHEKKEKKAAKAAAPAKDSKPTTAKKAPAAKGKKDTTARKPTTAKEKKDTAKK